jgi:predicted enzyme related to lactoylglutathione lyase
MTSAILNVTFDCTNARAVAGFWAAVTGWTLHEEDADPAQAEFSVGPPPGGTRLYFVTVGEPKITKNRVHLDVIPRDQSQDQEIARLTGLGATVIGGQPPGAGWVILADPEGNEFCVQPG